MRYTQAFAFSLFLYPPTYFPRLPLGYHFLKFAMIKQASRTFLEDCRAYPVLCTVQTFKF